MNWWYRLSLACGLVPLIIGILIFLGWLITRAHWLTMAGVFTLYIGLGVFVLGVIFLAIYFIQSCNNAVLGYRKKSSVSLLILLSNFPVYVAIMGTVIYVVGFSTVTIENQTKTKIEGLVLSERGHVYNIGIVLPNEKLEKNYRFQSEGAIHYFFIRNQKKYEGIVFGYVTGGIGSKATMLITVAGEVKIDQKI